MPVFLLVIANVVLSLSTPTASAGLVDRIEAIVNSQAVLMSDVRKFRQTIALRREIDPFMGLVGVDFERADQKTLLEYLVQETLITQSFKVSDAEVEQKVNDVLRSNNLSRQQLEQFLDSKGFTYQDYVDVMRIGLQKQTLLDQEIRARVNVSDDDVRNHYVNTLVKTPSAHVEYSLQLLAIDSNNFKSPKFAAETAQTARQALREGESFAEVVKRFGDPAITPDGGDLGFISSEHLNKEVLTAVKDLKIGEVSQVIQSGKLFYIAKLNDVRSQETQRLDAEKEKIREMLARQEYRRQLELWTERVKSSAFVKVN